MKNKLRPYLGVRIVAQNVFQPKHQGLRGDKAKLTVPVLKYYFLVRTCLAVTHSWQERSWVCTGDWDKIGTLRLGLNCLSWHL